MNMVLKLLSAIIAMAGYGLLLRYLAPSQEPYFILGLVLIGWISWLFGIIAGIACVIALFPATVYIYSQFEVSTSFASFATSPAYIAVEILTAVAIGRFRKLARANARKEVDLEETNTNLQAKLSQVQELGGVHALCTSCKKIKSDDGEWQDIDAYLQEKTKMEFSHGICPGCVDSYTKKQSTE
jgi:hypothetical protein